jgi:putative ABC transport system ATP-binding protein
VIDFFEEFNAEGRTIVMVTHDPKAAERAKRVIRLSQGRLVSPSNPSRRRVVA